jgi:hypothetical protein
MSGPTITRTPSGTVVLRFPFDRWLVDELKLEVPAHARTYDPAGKTWTITPTYASTAFRLMSAVFPDVDVVEQTSAGSADRAPHAGEDPWTILHLRPTAPLELVTAAHRCLAKLHHPDAGGNTTTMQSINAAVDQIRGTR